MESLPHCLEQRGMLCDRQVLTSGAARGHQWLVLCRAMYSAASRFTNNIVQVGLFVWTLLSWSEARGNETNQADQMCIYTLAVAALG